MSVEGIQGGLRCYCKWQSILVIVQEQQLQVLGENIIGPNIEPGGSPQETLEEEHLEQRLNNFVCK